MTRKETLRLINDYFVITIGLAISALGWTGFLIPSKIVAGGLTGFATLAYFLWSWDVGLTVLLLNSILILVAIKIIGRSYALKTLYGVVVFSAFLSSFAPFFSEPIVSDSFMATVIGGILAGIGGGIVFSKGGSMGGTDIIAMIINKYRNISLGRLLLMCDVIIIGSSFLILQSLEKMTYGFITMAILSYTVDLVITGNTQTIQMFIISKKYQEIAKLVIIKANRGVTILDGHGGYTGNEVKVLMVITRKRDSSIVLRLIKQIDPDAFITMGNVMGVYGKGFDQLKS